MQEPEKKPSLVVQFRNIMQDDSLPLSARILFGLAFSFGLAWSLGIALSNLLFS